MRRITPKTLLALALTFVICGILAGSAQADDHRHDRGRRYGDRRGHGWRGHDTVVYYEREPEVYYAPPLVVYPPPRAPSGISVFFPFWFR